MAKKWMPYHWKISLAEGEIPMDKGGFRTVTIDRAKVISEYERFVNNYVSLCTSHDYELDMHKAVLALLKEQEAQRDYEASVEMAEYCERYEQTYNPEDGSM